MQLHKLTCSYISLHGVTKLACRSLSLHAVPWTFIKFNELTWSSMSLHAVSWACKQFLSLSEQLTRISQCLLVFTTNPLSTRQKLFSWLQSQMDSGRVSMIQVWPGKIGPRSRLTSRWTPRGLPGGTVGGTWGSTSRSPNKVVLLLWVRFQVWSRKVQVKGGLQLWKSKLKSHQRWFELNTNASEM